MHHDQCISGEQSGPRMETENQAKQCQRHGLGSQEQLQAQKQQQQSLLEDEWSCDCSCLQEWSLLPSWTLSSPLVLAPCKKCVLWSRGTCGPVEREDSSWASAG